mgnify:CR=1 FL=1
MFAAQLASGQQVKLGTAVLTSSQVLTIVVAPAIAVGLSLFLTLFVMGPVFTKVNEEAVQPFLEGKIEQSEAFERGRGLTPGARVRRREHEIHDARPAATSPFAHELDDARELGLTLLRIGHALRDPRRVVTGHAGTDDDRDAEESSVELRRRVAAIATIGAAEGVALAIVVTLLVQSTTKPWLARRLGLRSVATVDPLDRWPAARVNLAIDQATGDGRNRREARKAKYRAREDW